MKYFMVTLAIVAALAVSAVAAGMNPDCKIFVTFDGAATDYAGVEAGRRSDPTAYVPVTGYIGMCDFESWTTISLKTAETAGMSVMTTYASLLPGGLVIGDWATGITLASTGPITAAVDGPFYFFASVTLIPTGTAGEVTILDHDEYPRMVVDFVGDTDVYCLWQNGGISMDPTPVEVECFGDTPVEFETWGSIKALYR
ncbi:hypothetical protein K8S17_05325 [bacterium]|nr:hypothetical protein [bacterium]